jgi:hypothetical protein
VSHSESREAPSIEAEAEAGAGESAIIVFVTVPDPDLGARIGRTLVEERLAACV